MKTKKGIALNQAFGAVITLVLVAVLVIVAILIFVSINTSFIGAVSASVINEAVSPTDIGQTNNGTILDAVSNCSSGSFTGAEIHNTSNAVNADNYTLTSSGTLRNLTSDFPGTWTVNYTYSWGSEACTAGENLITQFATYPALVGLVGTVIFLGLVIGVLVASFVFGGKGGV